jgi:hypothetical protein
MVMDEEGGRGRSRGVKEGRMRRESKEEAVQALELWAPIFRRLLATSRGIDEGVSKED